MIALRQSARTDSRMKNPTKNGPGVPLQFGGKAGRLAPPAPPEARVSERFVTTQSTAAEAPANPAPLQGSNAEEIEAVAVMAENAIAFASQLSQFQRSANVAIVCTCLPILGVYAFFGLANI